jgi:hypothetical protein
MALPMFFTGVLELWRNGEDPVSNGRNGDIKNYLAGDQKKQHFSKIITDSRGSSSFLFQHSLAQTSHQGQGYLSTRYYYVAEPNVSPSSRTRAGQYSNKSLIKYITFQGQPKASFNLKRIYSNRVVCQEMIL